jgi:hypothetical protein
MILVTGIGFLLGVFASHSCTAVLAASMVCCFNQHYYTQPAQNVNKSQKLVWLQFVIGLSLPSQNRNKVFRRVGQGVKTPPFHGGITGSNPVRGTGSPAEKAGFFIYASCGSTPKQACRNCCNHYFFPLRNFH